MKHERPVSKTNKQSKICLRKLWLGYWFKLFNRNSSQYQQSPYLLYWPYIIQNNCVFFVLKFYKVMIAKLLKIWKMYMSRPFFDNIATLHFVSGSFENLLKTTQKFLNWPEILKLHQNAFMFAKVAQTLFQHFLGKQKLFGLLKSETCLPWPWISDL